MLSRCKTILGTTESQEHQLMQMDRTPTDSAVSFGDKILIMKFETSVSVSCIDVLTVVNINKLAGHVFL